MPSAYNTSTPVGTIHAFGGGVVPAGWLLCDGSSYAQASFASLYSAIGGAFGTSGANFNVPDLRGRFLRGTDNMGTGAAGRDSDAGSRTAMNTGGSAGNLIGSIQPHAMQAHYHMVGIDQAATTGSFAQPQLVGPAGTMNSISYAGQLPYAGNLAPSTSNNSGNTSTSETRPLNANANYIIKY